MEEYRSEIEQLSDAAFVHAEAAQVRSAAHELVDDPFSEQAAEQMVATLNAVPRSQVQTRRQRMRKAKESS